MIAVAPGTQAEGLDGTQIDLVRPGQRAVVAQGGSGGRGNKSFATATRQTPRFAELGLEGESGWIDLRLKLRADAGIVGMPNAGKSSLLGRLTRAAPKVADYPFTTVEPVLGTLETDERQIVLADIPGLIEGASAGAGLGDEFLAHVERCRMLVHAVDIAPTAGDPESAYLAVRGELRAYGAGLADLPELVVLSKSDLVPEEAGERAAAEWRSRLGDRVLGVVAASSVTGSGLDRLRDAIVSAVASAGHGVASPAPDEEEYEAEHRIYRPVGEPGFSVQRLARGKFRIEGRGIELLMRRHDLANPEALAYVESRLAEIGVFRALEAAGFSSGDEVVVGERSFELHPDSG